MKKTVKMRHPKLPGQDIEVPESAARVHSNSGWEVIADDEAEATGEGGDTGRRASRTPARRQEPNKTEEAGS